MTVINNSTSQPSSSTTAETTTTTSSAENQNASGSTTNEESGADNNSGDSTSGTDQSQTQSYDEAIQQATSAGSEEVRDTEDFASTEDNGSDYSSAQEELDTYASGLDYDHLTTDQRDELYELIQKAVSASDDAAQLQGTIDTVVENTPEPPATPPAAQQAEEAKKDEATKEKKEEEKARREQQRYNNPVVNYTLKAVSSRIRTLNSQAVAQNDFEAQGELQALNRKLFELRRNESKNLTAEEYKQHGDGFTSNPEKNPLQKLRDQLFGFKGKPSQVTRALADANAPVDPTHTEGEAKPIEAESGKPHIAAKPKTAKELKLEADKRAADKEKRNLEAAQTAADKTLTADPGKPHLLEKVLPALVKFGKLTEEAAEKIAKQILEGAKATVEGVENAALSIAVGMVHAGNDEEGGSNENKQHGAKLLMGALHLVTRGKGKKAGELVASGKAWSVRRNNADQTTTAPKTYTSDAAQLGMNEISSKGQKPVVIGDYEPGGAEDKTRVPLDQALATKTTVPARDLQVLDTDNRKA